MVQLVQTKPMVNTGQPVAIISPKELKESKVANARVLEILSNFDSPSTILVGNKIIEQISSRTESILDDIGDKNHDMIKNQLSNLLTLTHSFNLIEKKQEPEEKHWLGALLSMVKLESVKTKEQILSEVNSITTQMDRLVKEIELSSESALKKSESLQSQYKINLDDYIELEGLVNDLSDVLALKKQELAKLKINGDTDLLRIETQNQLSKKIDRLEKKIVDIKKFQMMLMQNAPYISKLEDQAISLVDKFHQVKTMTIPLWKRQIKLYFDAMDLAKSSTLADNISTANNTLLVETSTTIGQTLVSITKTNNTDMISDNTLQTINDALILQLSEVAQIDEEARTARQTSLSMMETMLSDYKNIQLTN
ncbi:MAG: toxic anion resistance protein [Bacteroidales bacterium]|jgi:uncharacterized protein YaaN involved in tellurite resistance